MSYRVEQLSENVTLYCGDSAELYASLPREAGVCSDPPYGINYQHGTRRGGRKMGTDGCAIVGDDKPFDPAPWLQFRETLVWGAEHFKSRLPDGGRWLVWNKRRVGVVRDQGSVENAWHSVAGVTRLIDHPWDGADLGCERGQPRVHSNQKPVEVMVWCLGFMSSQHIIDPFMGSGTTGVACVRQGLAFTGIEIDERHFDNACRRVAEEISRPRLFSAPSTPVYRQEALL